MPPPLTTHYTRCKNTVAARVVAAPPCPPLYAFYDRRAQGPPPRRTTTLRFSPPPTSIRQDADSTATRLKSKQWSASVDESREFAAIATEFFDGDRYSFDIDSAATRRGVEPERGFFIHRHTHAAT